MLDDDNQSWKNIPINTKKKPFNAYLLKKKIFSFLKFALLMLAIFSSICLIGFAVYLAVNKDPKENIAKNILNEISFKNDGVVSKDWICQFANIKKGQNMSFIDVSLLAKKIKSIDQVKEVHIKKILPSLIEISIEEKKPICKIYVQDNLGNKTLLLADKNGFIFKSISHTNEDLKNLLYIDDIIVIKNQDSSYKSIPEISTLHWLLETANIALDENEINSWKYASIKNLKDRTDFTGARIVITKKSGKKIIFSPKDMQKQMNRLVVTKSSLKARQIPYDIIDLTTGQKVYVKLSQTNNDNEQ